MFEPRGVDSNHFMKDRALPRPVRLTLREYFQSARGVHQVAGDADLLAKMVSCHISNRGGMASYRTFTFSAAPSMASFQRSA